MPAELLADHHSRVQALRARMRAQRGAAKAALAPLGLHKRDSNLFRERQQGGKQRLDLSAFTHVLDINTAEGWVDVEGLCTFEDLVAQTLPQGVMPAVVPQLKTITVGGAVSGVAIEASSHRWGLVHHTLLQCDVLLPSGQVLHCRPDNAHRDLFYGLANSYGTLGYVLRLRLRTVPVKPFVRLDHQVFDDAAAFFAELEAGCGKRVNMGVDFGANRGQDLGPDFVDGVVFGPQQLVLSCATLVDTAPWLADYSYEHIYYRSLLDKPTDYLRVQDYLWRWDTDWFWCSKNIGAQHPLLRRLLGRQRLNSRTYTRIMRWNARWGLSRTLARCRGRFSESVIQDVDIPLERAADFLDFLLRDIGILPIWICPLRAPVQVAPAADTFPLYPLAPERLYVNFGFWDVVQTNKPHARGHFNRLIEREALRLGGIKSLYSDSYFTREEFEHSYGMAQYRGLKYKYDPQGQMLGLYEKCVLGG